MADQKIVDLPEGTDEVVEGANSGALAIDPTGRDQGGQTITVGDTALIGEEEIAVPKGDAERPVVGSGSAEGGLSERLRSGRERFASQAGDKARGLVSQGLERTSETLANVAKMVGDTAPGIDERLGEEYGGYARRAAGAIENVASAIADKDPDELIEDTRTFVRNSPGIALAGAAVVGFVVARLLKTGLARDEDEED
ncbi:MAG TPA: hypothetical protein VHS33_03500 [Sphingomicrobium sp.]|jgi:ElaB/YqjD/DUF883 family membrane-anchored ribosome-binding protein|nr:hypothetical protein [Sphingomicrobium sp.]